MKGLLAIVLPLLGLVASSAGAQSNPLLLAGSDPAQPTLAQKTSTKVYRYTGPSGTVSFSDRAPMNRDYQVVEIITGCYACSLKSTVDWHTTPLHLNVFQGHINTAARTYGVDPALVRAVIHAESAFRPNAKSTAGALGLMQLMPSTARDMGVPDPLSPEDNIRGGVRYLAWLLQRNSGNITLATAAYNAGPGAVERHAGVPPYEETRTYIKRVAILFERYKEALASPS